MQIKESIGPSADERENELIELLSEADDDVKNGRTAPIEDTIHNLRNILKD